MLSIIVTVLSIFTQLITSNPVVISRDTSNLPDVIVPDVFSNNLFTQLKSIKRPQQTLQQDSMKKFNVPKNFFSAMQKTPCPENKTFVQSTNDNYEIFYDDNNKITAVVKRPIYTERRCLNEDKICCSSSSLTRCKTHKEYKQFAKLKKNDKGIFCLIDGKVEGRFVGQYCKCEQKETKTT